MTATVSVGQFATMTHLSIKTLRHYHQVGLLEPARVDAHTGYRHYSLEQLPAAQLIRRLRNLKMPVAEVRSVLTARDPEQRNVLIANHMDRLEAELAQTRSAVDSLRTLLDTVRTRTAVSQRAVPAMTSIAITDTIGPNDVVTWWEGALSELHALVREADLQPTGTAGGLFDEALYQQDIGEATVFIPVAHAPSQNGRIRALEIPAVQLAVTVHRGSHADIDLAYADLGSYLAEHHIRVGQQIREHYLCDQFDTPDTASWQTEIAWPILD
jgi:DNA-binding transcriptional MerR regulator